jgi:hypothetical protein
MVLRIQYKNGKYDYVKQRTLNALIKKEAIEQFHRPNEKKWVNINIDSRRGERLSLWTGKKAGNPLANGVSVDPASCSI